jgi:predicted hotdog family 3-hydroxylacyl-ACP dehydratase
VTRATDPGAPFPGIAELLPHTGRALLLSEVLFHEATHTACRVDISESSPYFKAVSGGVPSWVALEYMAQTIAAHAGLRAWAKGEAPKIGFVVGTRRLTLTVPRFDERDSLTVFARETWNDGVTGRFECGVQRGGVELGRGALTVYQPAAPRSQ